MVQASGASTPPELHLSYCGRKKKKSWKVRDWHLPVTFVLEVVPLLLLLILMAKKFTQGHLTTRACDFPGKSEGESGRWKSSRNFCHTVFCGWGQEEHFQVGVLLTSLRGLEEAMSSTGVTVKDGSGWGLPKWEGCICGMCPGLGTSSRRVAQRKRAELEVSKIKRLRGGGGDRSREKETNKQLGQTQIATFNYIIYF